MLTILNIHVLNYFNNIYYFVYLFIVLLKTIDTFYNYYFKGFSNFKFFEFGFLPKKNWTGFFKIYVSIIY